MYANRRLGAFTDVLSDIVQAGRDIYMQSRLPSITTYPAPSSISTPPFIDPRTGAYLPTQPAPDYTVPLLIGAGGLLLLMMARRRRG